jgi:hypothetical protein
MLVSGRVLDAEVLGSEEEGVAGLGSGFGGGRGGYGAGRGGGLRGGLAWRKPGWVGGDDGVFVVWGVGCELEGLMGVVIVEVLISPALLTI